MKKLTIGILAHVDSGKTTLSEALLYSSGAIRSLGRVDHKNTFLDSFELERKRGITIFSKLARLKISDCEITLLDTPGHVDFSAETERTLQVLDGAILVVSGSSGVQSHTETLWHLLRKHNIPTFIFVNKMDISNADKETLLSGIHKRLSSRCVDFTDGGDMEEIAMCDEEMMNAFLEDGYIDQKLIRNSVTNCGVFPCLFGSALKMDGTAELLSCICENLKVPKYEDLFGARVYKITHDESGARLTHMKITGGKLAVKSLIEYSDRDGNQFSQKIEQIRLYQGEKYENADVVESGTVCTVTGLSALLPGDRLGFELEKDTPSLIPVLNFRIILPKGIDAHTSLKKIRILEAEDPTLRVTFNEQSGEIHLLLMGEIQLEIIKHQIKSRFGMDVEFGTGSIMYMETIDGSVEGVGHYEPLRHYSEVHLLLEQGERGTGLIFSSDCDTDDLDRNWQRLILSHLEEKTHIGVLTGAPITDMKITLVSGRAHKKHTEGGDFRQATYRAVRHGLMKAKSVLLEPWYSYEITVPTENIGRVMSDIQSMNGTMGVPDSNGEESTLCGTAPVSKIMSYPALLSDFSHGKGRISLTLKGYDICHNAHEVIAEKSYNPEADLDNSPDSIFCESGAAIFVRWSDVENYMHLPSIFSVDKDAIEEQKELKRRAAVFCAAAATDKELMEIFERTYGKIRRRDEEEKVKYNPSVANDKKVPKQTPKPMPDGPEYLLIDGYNIIFAWDEYRDMASSKLEYARNSLIERLCNYQGFSQLEIILVFDAYKVHKNPGSVENFRNIKVVYTKEAETADTYIEKASHKLSKNHIVRVATSDGPEQMIILGNGALRVPAQSFINDVLKAEKAIHEYMSDSSL